MTTAPATAPAPAHPPLSQLAHGGGCGCKLAPGVLSEILARTPASGRRKRDSWSGACGIGEVMAIPEEARAADNARAGKGSGGMMVEMGMRGGACKAARGCR